MKRPPLVPAYRVLSMPGSMAREKTSTCARGRPALMGLQLFPPFVLLNRPLSFFADRNAVALSGFLMALTWLVGGLVAADGLLLTAPVLFLTIYPSVQPYSV